MKRILGLILVSMMLMTMILPVGAEAKAVPEVGEMIYSTSFDGTTIDAAHFSDIQVADGGSLTQENGKLHFVEAGTGTDYYTDRTRVNFYPYANDKESVLTGKFVVEYTWEKTDAWWGAEAFLFGSSSAHEEANEERIRLMSYKANDEEPHTSKMFVGYSDTAGGQGPNDYIYTSDQFDMDTNVIKMTIAVDPGNHTLDLWINDQFAGSFDDLQISGLQRIQFDTYGHKSRISDITLDNLSVYTVEASSKKPVISLSEDVQYGYSDDFSGAKDSRIELNHTGATYENSAINFSGSGEQYPAKIYLNKDQSSYAGSMVFELTVEKSVASAFGFYLAGSSGSVADFRWRGNELIMYKKTESGQEQDSLYGTAETKAKITVKYDSNKGEIELYFNDNPIIKVMEDKASYVLNAGDVNYIGLWFYDEGAGSGSFSVKDFKWYATPTSGVSTAWETLYHEDFDGATIDAKHVSAASGVSTRVQENGALTVTTVDSAGVNVEGGVTVYGKSSSDTSPFTGDHVMEVYMSRPKADVNTNRARIYFGGSFYIDWLYYNYNSFDYRAHNGSGWNSDVTVSTAAYDAQVGMKITVKFDSRGVSFWINDNFVTTIDGIRPNNSIVSLGAYTGDGAPTLAGVVRIEDVRIFKPVSGGALEQVSNEIWENIYHEDFAGESVDTAHVKLPTANATTSLANGKLSVSTVNSESNTVVYLNEDQSAVTGDFVLEAELSRPTKTSDYIYDDRVRVYIGSLYVDWQYQINNLEVSMMSDGNGTVNALTTAGCNAQYNLKIKAHFNSFDGTVSLWINDVLAVDNYRFNDKNSASVTNITFAGYPELDGYYGATANSGTYCIEDVSVNVKTGVENKIKFAAGNTQEGYLAFVTYGEGGTVLSTLDDLNFLIEAGKVYSLDAEDWAGKQVYLWNSELQPLAANFVVE